MCFIALLLAYLCVSGGNTYAEIRPSHRVVVSIAPYQFFVHEIAGDTVQISLLVPPGASFHYFEPSPKQILQAAHSDIWFRLGEPFEERALNALQGHNRHLRVVDLREGVDLITVDAEGHQGCCHVGGADLHIWLSPKQAKIQAKAIAHALMEAYPENTELYGLRLERLLAQLDQLDQQITEKLRPLKNRTLMVAHSAYAYYARDYKLEQLPIEFEGKDPSPRQLDKVLNEARKAHIKVIFTQPQYSSKGAQLLAKELGGKVVSLDPYSGDYFVMMHTITDRIAAQDAPPEEK